jgi:hypothetical protein
MPLTKPPLGSCANDVIALSISAALRTANVDSFKSNGRAPSLSVRTATA